MSFLCSAPRACIVASATVALCSQTKSAAAAAGFYSPRKGTNPHPSVCAFLCKGPVLASVHGAAAGPLRAADLLLLTAGRRRDFGGRSLQSQALPRRLCCLCTSPEYMKCNFLLLCRELVNISLGHGGSLKSLCFKKGQLSAALGLAFGFPSSCYNSFCGFNNR